MNCNDLENEKKELPGVLDSSNIRDVYKALKSGRVLTSLDAVKSLHTVNLAKYISLLRLKFRVPIKDRWIKTSKNKQFKQYYIEPDKSISKEIKCQK